MGEAAQQARLRVEGMCCTADPTTIERAVRRVPGVAGAAVSYQAALLTVHLNGASLDDVVVAVAKAGYKAIPDGAAARPEPSAEARPAWLGYLLRERQAQLTALAALLFAAGAAAPLLPGAAAGTVASPGTAPWLYAAAIVTGGWYTLRASWAALRVRAFNIDVLTVIAAAGACVIGEWQEGAAVVVLFAIGNLLEEYTAERARGSIRSLIDLAPPTALLLEAGSLRKVVAADVPVGAVVRVNPGERVPLDGVVVAGTSEVNQAPITGESVPVHKAPGSQVFAGTVNASGGLDIRVTAASGQTTLDRIIRLTEEAQASRAPSERLINRFAAWYTPLVLVVAAVVGIAVPLLLQLDFTTWFYRSLGLLIVACPCALVISTPASVVAGLGRAARAGLLIKGGAHLERSAAVSIIAMDKTGTVTVGRPAVVTVQPLDPQLGAKGLLALAAAVESGSSHPLAHAVLAAAPGYPQASGFEALPGLGVSAVVGGTRYWVGSPRLFAERFGHAAPERVSALQAAGQTVVLVGTEQRLVGLIGLADELRPGAAAAVAALKRQGIGRILLLSGDAAPAVAAAGAALGIEARGELLPEQKLAVVHALRREGTVAMVGDGINDAPALAASDLGIAMGAAGSAAAVESADIALMGDEIGRLPFLFSLGRRTVSTIRANVIFAVGVKLAAVVLLLTGNLGLWGAVLADTGAAVLVTLNGVRILGHRG